MNQKTKVLLASRQSGYTANRSILNSFTFFLIIMLIIAGLFLSSCSASRSGYGCPTNNPAAKASYRR